MPDPEVIVKVDPEIVGEEGTELGAPVTVTVGVCTFEGREVPERGTLRTTRA